MEFAKFMGTPAGRTPRVIASLIIIGIALQSIGGTPLSSGSHQRA